MSRGSRGGDGGGGRTGMAEKGKVEEEENQEKRQGHVVFAVISYLRLHQILAPGGATSSIIDPVISVRAEPRPKSPVQVRLGLPPLQSASDIRNCYSILDDQSRQCNIGKENY